MPESEWGGKRLWYDQHESYERAETGATWQPACPADCDGRITCIFAMPTVGVYQQGSGAAARYGLCSK